MQILTHALKFCSVILQFLSIFDMARLICNSPRAFILPHLTKFQEKKILSWCFKFDDLNLELVEAIEILNVSVNLRLLLFETMKIVFTILKYSLLTVLGLCSHYHGRIALGHSVTSPSTFVPITQCHFSC